MKITKEWLVEKKVCVEAIEELERDWPSEIDVDEALERLVKEGNYLYVHWLVVKLFLLGERKEYYVEYPNGYREWWDYNKAGLCIHFKDFNGEEWWEYNDAGLCIHFKNSNGYEKWFEYNDAGLCIRYKDSYGDKKCWEYNFARKEGEKNESKIV